MRPSVAIRRAADHLARHDVESPQANAEVLMAFVLGTDRAGIYACTERLSAEEALRFARALDRRCAGTPLQHLTGEQVFRGITVRVRPGVFVPRPETELLVHTAVELLEGRERSIVVDVGTGTGAIALALASELPAARVLATDLSADAVELARENAAALGLAVEVLRGDLLVPVPTGLGLDLVVGNPPYVEAGEYEALPADVRADPELALVGGIAVYERLVIAAAERLRPHGALAVEIGSTQGVAVTNLLWGRFDEVRVLADLAGRDRIVTGRRR